MSCRTEWSVLILSPKTLFFLLHFLPSLFLLTFPSLFLTFYDFMFQLYLARTDKKMSNEINKKRYSCILANKKLTAWTHSSRVFHLSFNFEANDVIFSSLSGQWWLQTAHVNLSIPKSNHEINEWHQLIQ